MGKLGWIIVLVLLFLLFHERIGAGLDSVTRPSYAPGFGGPVPGPSYYSSPPTSQHSSWTDVLTGVINAGATIYNGAVRNSSSPSSGGFAPGPGEDGGYG
jgi:hypothetical protein